MNGPVLSPLFPGDVIAVARIHAACFDDAWNVDMLRRILNMPGSFGLAARLGDAGGPLVGFALARVGADECELLSLGVAPEHRRTGIGAILLDASMVRAAAAKARKFFLEVAEDNEAALDLYEARGLLPVGRRPNYYELKGGGFADALTLRVDLRNEAVAES